MTCVLTFKRASCIWILTCELRSVMEQRRCSSWANSIRNRIFLGLVSLFWLKRFKSDLKRCSFSQIEIHGRLLCLSLSSTTEFSCTGVKKKLGLDIKNSTLKKNLQLEKVGEHWLPTIPPGSEFAIDSLGFCSWFLCWPICQSAGSWDWHF